MTVPSLSLDGRVAAVTGAGSGIGRGIALGLAASGARVALLERDAQRAHQVADEITAAGGTALALPTDVRIGAEVDRAVGATCGQLGGIDVLVNNVGGSFVAPFLETNERGWTALWRQNLEHIFHCTRAAAQRMVAQGRGGSIINVVSIEGVRAAPRYAVYAAAKAGAISFTKTMALELAHDGIRVNAIAPDMCITEGLQSMNTADELKRAVRMIPMGRAAVPQDIAGVAVFLASDLAGYITGETVHVDGGTHAAGGWYPHPDDGHYVLGPGWS